MLTQLDAELRPEPHSGVPGKKSGGGGSGIGSGSRGCLTEDSGSSRVVTGFGRMRFLGVGTVG